MNFLKHHFIKIILVITLLSVSSAGGVFVVKQFKTTGETQQQTQDVAGATTESVDTPSPSPEATPTPKTSTAPVVIYKEPSPVPTTTPAISAVNVVSPTPQSPTTYRTLTLPELVNMNGANNEAISAAYSAYNTFLQTPNLQYMDFSQQRAVFTPLLTAAIQKSLDQYKSQLQAEIDALDQQTQEINQINAVYEECVNNKIATINNNPYLSESARLSQIEKAKQECAN